MTLEREVDEHKQQVVSLALAMKILTVFYKKHIRIQTQSKGIQN